MAQIIGSSGAIEAFAGIDWGGSSHELCVVDATGQVITRKRIAHDVAGFAELDTILTRLPGRLRIAIERADGVLVEHLQHAGFEVYCVSPKISARARERYRLAAAKSDGFDAFVLADTLRHEHGHWRPLVRPSALQAELRVVSRDRERLVEIQRAAESRLRAVLDAYHRAPLHLFSRLDRDITLSFVADYPTPAQAGRVGARSPGSRSRRGCSSRSSRCSTPICGRSTSDCLIFLSCTPILGSSAASPGSAES